MDRIALTVALLSIAAAGCAPVVNMPPSSPDGPQISALEFVPERTTVGCPVTVRFRLARYGGEALRGVAGWVHRGGRVTDSGYSMVPLVRTELSGSALSEAVITVTPERRGTYWYYVQVQDQAGRRSNVLEKAIAVDAAWLGALPTCP